MLILYTEYSSSDWMISEFVAKNGANRAKPYQLVEKSDIYIL